MIDYADITISAWDNDKLVGTARAITDFSYCCYLSDLAVNKEYQNKGIGTKLVNILQEKIGDEGLYCFFRLQLQWNTIRTLGLKK